jgi:hypothetical protein
LRDRLIRAARAAVLAAIGLGLAAADAAAQPIEAPAPRPAWLPPSAPAVTTTPAEMADQATEADVLEELDELESEASALQIYGFADFTYTRFLMDESSAWYDTYFSVNPTFAVGNLNLYLEKRIAPGWRSLVEFRLLYLPNGTEEISESTGDASRIDTTVIDPLDKLETLRWGGIAIERAWVEYEVHPLATVRAGQWLTPYGIWNVDHGSPVLIPVRRPFLIGQGMFPRNQTGVMVHGARAVGDTRVAYKATLSNGRGPVDTYLDLDGNKAVGGRLTLDLPVLDELTLGASAYTGTYTARTRTYGLGGDEVVADDTVTERYRELATGVDLRARSGPVLLNAELIAREVRYDDAARPRAMTSVGEQQPDFLAYGTYVLVGVRLPWWGLMPYAVGEYTHPMWMAAPHLAGGMVGINLRAAPTVTLKTQLQFAGVIDARSNTVPDDMILNWEAQIAWVF